MIDAPEPASDKPKIAAFDFDGTITYCDTLLPFLRHVAGFWRFWLGQLLMAPWTLLWVLRIYSNRRYKEHVITQYLRGWTVEDIEAKTKVFVEEILPRLANPEALERIDRHKAAGYRVIIVSASPRIYVAAFGATIGVDETLATTLEHQDGVVTGKIRGDNVYGRTKAVLILAYLEREWSIATERDCYLVSYGDSKGDQDMLKISHEGFYRIFDVSLIRKMARFWSAVW